MAAALKIAFVLSLSKDSASAGLRQAQPERIMRRAGFGQAQPERFMQRAGAAISSPA